MLFNEHTAPHYEPRIILRYFPQFTYCLRFSENRRMKHKKESKAKGIPYSPTGTSQMSGGGCGSAYDGNMPQHQHKCQATTGGPNKCGQPQPAPNSLSECNQLEQYRSPGVILHNSQSQPTNQAYHTDSEAVLSMQELTDHIHGGGDAKEDLKIPKSGKAAKNLLKRSLPKSETN